MSTTTDNSPPRAKINDLLGQLADLRADFTLADLWFILWRGLPAKATWALIGAVSVGLIGAFSLGISLREAGTEPVYGSEAVLDPERLRSTEVPLQSGLQTTNKPISPRDKHYAITAGVFGVHFSMAAEHGTEEEYENLREPVVRSYTILGIKPGFYEEFIYGKVPHDALRMYVTVSAGREAGRVLGPEATAALRFGNQMALSYGYLY